MEELCRSRNVSKTQLLHSAGDLFVDVAKVWYRANFREFHTWEQMVKGLREEFHPPDYDMEIYEEIRKRTQGKFESIGIYFALMTTLFGNLTTHYRRSLGCE